MFKLTDTEIQIKQGTKIGFIAIPFKSGRYAVSIAYPTSLTRRGRVQENGLVTPTLTCTCGIAIFEISQKTKGDFSLNNLRIRKFTPREYGRLMGVDDNDITIMEKINSNTQLYKQFGNSIVVDVMYYVLKPLFDE